MKTIVTALFAFPLMLQATLVPGPIFSGDGTGYISTFGVSSSEYVITPGNNFPVLPAGISPVSFSSTGKAPNGTIVEFVDQWGFSSPGELSSLDWYSSGPTTIFLDGGVVGVVSTMTGDGPHSGVIDLSFLSPGYHYFAAFVAQDSYEKDDQRNPLAFAYRVVPSPSSVAPEPSTLFLLGGSLLLFAGRRLKKG